MIEIPKDKPNDYQPIPSNLGSFMSSVAATEQVEEAPLNPPQAADPEPDFEDLGTINGGEGGMNWPPEDEEEHPGQKKVSRFSGEMMARFTDPLLTTLRTTPLIEISPIISSIKIIMFKININSKSLCRYQAILSFLLVLFALLIHFLLF